MIKVLTPKFRVSYPNVFKARLNELSSKEEFSLVALFPKNADLSALKKAVDQAMTEKWGEEKKRPKGITTPFRDQGERAKETDGKETMPAGYEKGAVFLNLKSQRRPGVVDQNLQDIIEETEIYAGAWARATVSAYAWEFKSAQGAVLKRGVSFGLLNLQKVSDGDPLVGKSSPQDDFSPIEIADEGASAEALFK
jgi:hypothetical protein